MDYNYQPIFDYIDKGQTELREEFRVGFVSKSDINEVKTMIANLSTQVQTYDQELLV